MLLFLLTYQLFIHSVIHSTNSYWMPSPCWAVGIQWWTKQRPVPMLCSHSRGGQVTGRGDGLEQATAQTSEVYKRPQDMKGASPEPHVWEAPYVAGGGGPPRKAPGPTQMAPESYALCYLCWYHRSLQTPPDAAFGQELLTVVFGTWRWPAISGIGERAAKLLPCMEHIFFSENIIQSLTPTLKSSPETEMGHRAAWDLCC